MSKFGYCGNLTDQQMDREFVAAYRNQSGGPTDSDLDRINRKWRQLRKLAQVNRLGGVQTQG